MDALASRADSSIETRRAMSVDWPLPKQAGSVGSGQQHHGREGPAPKDSLSRGTREFDRSAILSILFWVISWIVGKPHTTTVGPGTFIVKCKKKKRSDNARLLCNSMEACRQFLLATSGRGYFFPMRTSLWFTHLVIFWCAKQDPLFAERKVGKLLCLFWKVAQEFVESRGQSIWIYCFFF